MEKKSNNLVRLSGGLQNDVFYDKSINKVVRKSKSQSTKEMILQEVEWVNFLHINEVNVPKPEMTIEEENGRIITYFEYIDGEQIDVTNSQHWNKNMFEQWGKLLGKMHFLAKSNKFNKVIRPIWSQESTDIFRIKVHLPHNMKKIYNNYMNQLLEFRISPDTFGLIHNDFHQGNLILVEDTLFSIDFDDCSYNWFAQDIATAFYHAYWQHNSFNKMSDQFVETYMGYFFRGYKNENSLHNDIVKQIPIFLKLREIFLYQLFIQKWDLNQLADWQKYTLTDLKDKIYRGVPYAGITNFLIYL